MGSIRVGIAYSAYPQIQKYLVQKLIRFSILKEKNYKNFVVKMTYYGQFQILTKEKLVPTYNKKLVRPPLVKF